MKFDQLLVSCEHASNKVPGELTEHFAGADDVLASHRGWDIGAAWLARHYATALSCKLIEGQWTRLLADLNRSSHNRDVFSEFTRSMGKPVRNDLLSRFWRPYREDTEGWLRRSIDQGKRVLHLSVHSFTPVFDGAERSADIGLLYDPKRVVEKDFCLGWQRRMRDSQCGLRVRRNYPYTGYQDGFVPYLQKVLSPDFYFGMELEVNQALLSNKQARIPAAQALIATFSAQAGMACREAHLETLVA